MEIKIINRKIPPIKAIFKFSGIVVGGGKTLAPFLEFPQRGPKALMVMVNNTKTNK